MIDLDRGLSRRTFGLSLAALAAVRAAAAPLRLPTPEQGMGPFFPVEHPRDTDADLSWIKGHARRAQGKVIEVAGRVLDRRGNPVSGARLDLWQCNSLGRYAHANDVAAMPLDPDFQGFASIRSGREGEWRITTIKPAAYDSPIGKRTPHIHFDVSGRSHRLVTQMYFSDDDATNSKDGLYRELGGDAERAVARLDSSGRYDWTIVLMDGGQ